MSALSMLRWGRPLSVSSILTATTVPPGGLPTPVSGFTGFGFGLGFGLGFGFGLGLGLDVLGGGGVRAATVSDPPPPLTAARVPPTAPPTTRTPARIPATAFSRPVKRELNSDRRWTRFTRRSPPAVSGRCRRPGRR